jgi:hypothetical protein
VRIFPRLYSVNIYDGEAWPGRNWNILGPWRLRCTIYTVLRYYMVILWPSAEWERRLRSRSTDKYHTTQHIMYKYNISILYIQHCTYVSDAPKENGGAILVLYKYV